MGKIEEDIIKEHRDSYPVFICISIAIGCIALFVDMAGWLRFVLGAFSFLWLLGTLDNVFSSDEELAELYEDEIKAAEKKAREDNVSKLDSVNEHLEEHKIPSDWSVTDFVSKKGNFKVTMAVNPTDRENIFLKFYHNDKIYRAELFPVVAHEEERTVLKSQQGIVVFVYNDFVRFKYDLTIVEAARLGSNEKLVEGGIQ